MNIKINENYKNLGGDYLFCEIASRVKRYAASHSDAEILRLGIGDVTLPLTRSVTDAMTKAVAEMGEKATFRGYALENGYEFLRGAIARHYTRFGACVDDDEVFVSDGAKCDAANLTELFGDNTVIITDPVYPVYADSNIMAGRRIKYIAATAENDFLPSPDGLTERCAVIYICSPNNPTGAVYDKNGLKKWVDFAISSGSLIIFDSAYEAYICGDFPHTVFEIDGARECAIEVCSLSKSAGFTGTRCSWTVIPKELKAGGVSINEMWRRRQTTKFNGVPYIVQRGAEAALSDVGQCECAALVGYYMKNAAIIADMLTGKGVFFSGGKSSPYIWMKCPKGQSSWEFFDFLLDAARVVGTPGVGFGAHGEGYFRLSSFGSVHDVAKAAKRLESVL